MKTTRVTQNVRRVGLLLMTFCAMSLVGHWYECLLELVQLLGGMELGYGGIWRQPLEPYLAYGWLAVAAVALAMVANYAIRKCPASKEGILISTVSVAGAVAILRGMSDIHTPAQVRLAWGPSIFSTILFTISVLCLAIKLERRILELPARRFWWLVGGSSVTWLFLQMCFGS